MLRRKYHHANHHEYRGESILHHRGQEGVKAVLKGVERALDQQERRPQWNAHRQGDKRIGDQHSLVHRDGRKQCADDRFGEHDHGGGEEYDQQPYVVQRAHQIVPCLIQIRSCDGTGDLGEHSRGYRYGDERIGQDEQGVRILIGRVACHAEQAGTRQFVGALRCGCGDTGKDNAGNLTGDHHAQRA